MAITSFPVKLREMGWDLVKTATFYMKSGKKIKARPPKGQKLTYDPNGDMIRYEDDDPASWGIPVLEVEAVYVTTIAEEDK